MKEDKVRTGEMVMTNASKAGAFIGVIIAILLIISSARQFPPNNPWLVVISCPPSIFLMATENTKWPMTALIGSAVALVNGVWYAVVFGLIGKLLVTKP